MAVVPNIMLGHSLCMPVHILDICSGDALQIQRRPFRWYERVSG